MLLIPGFVVPIEEPLPGMRRRYDHLVNVEGCSCQIWSSLPGDGVERSSVLIEWDTPLVNQEILDNFS